MQAEGGVGLDTDHDQAQNVAQDVDVHNEENGHESDKEIEIAGAGRPRLMLHMPHILKRPRKVRNQPDEGHLHNEKDPEDVSLTQLNLPQQVEVHREADSDDSIQEFDSPEETAFAEEECAPDVDINDETGLLAASAQFHHFHLMDETTNSEAVCGTDNNGNDDGILNSSETEEDEEAGEMKDEEYEEVPAQDDDLDDLPLLPF